MWRIDKVEAVRVFGLVKPKYENSEQRLGCALDGLAGEAEA
jgi:hypothetical protein